MPVANISGSSQTIAAPGATAVVYRGFSLLETSGSASALVRVFDGSATGTILDEIALTASQSAREIYAGFAMKAGSGLFVQVVSGTVTGSIRYEYA